ncbi:uncharacterized protein LOC135839364 [Planococcus citri]|uniref:uncharacterized protein LOC135839364 n=1 Tax=Planococcus citri TaxID=170843 RepID=UPI0031F8DAE3
MVVRCYRSRCSAAVFSAFYILLSLQCMVSSFSTKARLREESSVSRKPIYVIANSENTSEQPQLYTRHRRKLPAESNDQLNALDDDVPLQEYQGVFGRPGIDFPVLSSIPVTKFNCRHVKNSNTGYYADTDTNCQVFHVCDAGRKISFLCPNGTIFRQSHLICDWWFRVDCERSPELYDQSVQQLEADQNVHNNKQRVESIANAMQNAVNNKNSNDFPVLLSSPAPVTNAFKEIFNSESDLPNRNGGNSQRNTLRPQNYQSSSEPENRNNFNAITSPPRPSSFNAISPTFTTTELPYISTRLQSSENTKPNSGATASYTFVTSTYKPDVTPLIHNFLPPNDPGEGFREQQVLAETASFAGSGKFPFQNYYYMLNYVKHPSKENTANKASEFTTSNQGIETTQYQTESYTDNDESFRTTFYPNNAEFRDSNFLNTNNITENDNNSYSLYYSPTNEGINSFGTTLPDEFRDVGSSLSINDVSKPQVSEFILNSQSNSESNGETPTEQNLPLLTNMTQEAFNQLFPKDEKVAEQSNTTSIFRNSDLATEHSSGIVQSDAQKPQKQEILSNTLQFKSSPDLRELAQVFSRALSAYLENPEQFRKILSEVRPTEPPSTNDNANGEASSIDDEVLAFSEDVGMKSTPFPVKSTVAKNTNIPIDRVTFTTPAPVKSTIKDPETFAEEINNFMFADPHNFLGHLESNEFNVNETYYPTPGHPSNITTLPTTRTQFTVSPLLDFTKNVTRFSPSTSFTEAASTVSTTFRGIPKNDNLYTDLKPQSNPEIGQSLSEKEHFITADTQSFVSRDNLLRYQNNFKPSQNIKAPDTTQNFKPSPANQLPSVSQTKYDSDYQSIKSSKNMQFGMRTTSVTRAPFVSSRADFSSSTPSNTLTTKALPTSKATTYHPEARTTQISTYPTINNYQQSTANSVLDNRNSKNYNSDTYKDMSPDSGHFNETAKALINMMEEAKSNNVLRHQLVLLLVNDKGLPTENKSVKEMKSKLLKALLKPAPDKNTPRNYRNDSERISRSDHNSSIVTPLPTKARKERVVVHKHKVSSPNPQTTDSISKSTASSFQTTRSERSTSKPVVVAALTGANETPELSESDSRAVDLLKSLYTIASNNWTH